MSKEDKILSGLEKTFTKLDEKHDRLEKSVWALYFLMMLVTGVQIIVLANGVFS